CDGVSIGPLRATPLSRMDASARDGKASPVRSKAPSPISSTSQTMSPPVAATARRAASTTSGPIPSPGINVTRWGNGGSSSDRAGVSGTGGGLSWQARMGPVRTGLRERRIGADKGLREVIAADTKISDIDGEKGTLSYVG